MDFLLFAAALATPLPPAEIDKLFAVEGKSPGCAVAIVDHDRIVFANGYGLADIDGGKPITPDTPFNVASMTKQFTGMAIALLIADGKLSENDDIRKFLPELPNYGTPIRIANLLNHSSGLRNHMALAAFGPGDHLPSHAEALKLVFRQSALNFTPGTRHQYESPNYVLLAEIVSRVSGKRYPEFVASRILKPLGMARSGYARPDLGRAYAKTKDGYELREKVNGAQGSSGLLASVNDFARWMVNYDSHRVGGRAGFGKMMSTSKLADGSALSYRYGLSHEADYAGVSGLTRISHGGQTAAYRSAFSFFPGRGFGSVVMCNSNVDARGKELAISSAWIKRAFPYAMGPAEIQALPLPAGLADQLAGTYYSAEDDDIRTLVARDGVLKLGAFGQEFDLQYRGGNRFAFFDQGEFLIGDGQLTEPLADQAVLHFQRLPAFEAQDPAQFTGRYRSKDVDGEVIVEARDGKLVLRYPAGEAELTAVGTDRFSGQAFDFNHVAFNRDPSDRIAGMSFSVSSGITRLRFERAG